MTSGPLLIVIGILIVGCGSGSSDASTTTPVADTGTPRLSGTASPSPTSPTSTPAHTEDAVMPHGLSVECGNFLSPNVYLEDRVFYDGTAQSFGHLESLTLTLLCPTCPEPEEQHDLLYFAFEDHVDEALEHPNDFHWSFSHALLYEAYYTPNQHTTFLCDPDWGTIIVTGVWSDGETACLTKGLEARDIAAEQGCVCEPWANNACE